MSATTQPATTGTGKLSYAQRAIDVTLHLGTEDSEIPGTTR